MPQKFTCASLDQTEQANTLKRLSKRMLLFHVEVFAFVRKSKSSVCLDLMAKVTL